MPKYKLSLMLSFPTLLLILALPIQAQELQCDPPNLNGLPLQLATLAKQRPIDASCTCRGADKGPPGSTLNKANAFQNSLKSNFLAPVDNPKRITTRDMVRLQNKVDLIPQNKLPRGSSNKLPSESQRQRLHNISITGGKTFSEGDVVTLVGFIIGSRHSNVSISRNGVVTGGESVNCKLLGCSNNDMHIDISGKKLGQGETKEHRLSDDGVVAEIIPRHRPEAWDLLDSLDYRSFFRTHRVMFTGQLFYDAGHKPLISPVRASVWEIHPVYAIHVCLKTTAAACQPDQQDNPEVWVPFDQLKEQLGLTEVHTTAKCKKAP